MIFFPTPRLVFFILSFFHSFIFSQSSCKCKINLTPFTKAGSMSRSPFMFMAMRLQMGKPRPSPRVRSRTEVTHLSEWLEHLLTLLFRNGISCVQHNELVLVCTSFLIFQRDMSTLWSVQRGIPQQVRQDV